MKKNEKKLVNLPSDTDKRQMKMTKKDIDSLSDKEIVDGLKRKDERITREYFYKYCRIAYAIYNNRYGLEGKPGLDFYSIAHEYYLSLDRHDFRQLDDRNPSVKLKTWMVNGFRFVLLDRLKAYKTEFEICSMEERVGKSQLAFNIPDDDYRQEVNEMVREACNSFLGRDSRASIIMKMILVEGFKAKDVAAELGMTPSAVSQRYHKILDEVIIPYFRRNYESRGGVPCDGAAMSMDYDYTVGANNSVGVMYSLFMRNSMKATNKEGRVTPDFITSLKPNEVFVFGSNLAGMHGGGAARIAHLYFGAVMGNGDGIQGQSYAIPTMQGGVDTIRPYVDKFIAYAKQHPDQHFLVTRIGCGIAGFSPDEIAPLFAEAAAVENISLPEDFWEEIQ